MVHKILTLFVEEDKVTFCIVLESVTVGRWTGGGTELVTYHRE